MNITYEVVTCNCTECATHADRFGKTLPLAVDVPVRFAESLPRGKRGGFSTQLRHNLVQMGHEQSAMARALRSRNGITAI